MAQTSTTQGHGIEGSFGGLPDEYNSLKNATVVILPVPFDMTTSYQQGTDKGPEALIEASRNLELYDIETHSEVYKIGIHTAEPVKESSSKAMLKSAEERTLQYLNQGKFVVTLGGEHSISAAPIRAHAKKFAPFTVLQFDAHADLQDAYCGDPLSHASVMARVKEIKEVDKIVSVGIRSMSSDELHNLDRENTFFAHDLHQDTKWWDEVIEKLSDNVYITFDLDVFDSSLMSSTGTPEPGGLFWHQVLPLIKKVSEKKNIIGLDVVELMPQEGNPAPDFLAAKLVYKILSYLFHEKSKVE